MGNLVSMSCSFISPKMKSSKVSRVILPGGEVRQFREPVKAAEVMLESPNYFIVNSRSLNIGRRFSALAADEDLDLGEVYILFPMKRVNSVVTAADVTVLLMAASSARKRISGVKARVLPEVVAEAAKGASTVGDSPESDVGPSRLNLDDVEGFPAPEFRYRLAICRSRKPSLDTITEEPVWVR